MDSVGAPRVESGHDVGMHQPGDGSHFEVEPTHQLGIIGELLGKDLQRHVPLHRAMLSSKDLAHSSRTNLLKDLVLTEDW